MSLQPDGLSFFFLRDTKKNHHSIFDNNLRTKFFSSEVKLFCKLPLPCTVRTSRQRSCNPMDGCLLLYVLVCLRTMIYGMGLWTSARQDGNHAQVLQHPGPRDSYTSKDTAIQTLDMINTSSTHTNKRSRVFV